MKKFLLTAALIIGFAGVAQAADYTVDYGTSEVGFSGTHAGNAFKGKFEEWTAEISFDPTALEQSSFKASFKPASAKTGNKMYDGTLPTVDWFDAANHPQATFASTSIVDDGKGGYTAKGDLTIRGITHPAEFGFTLSDLDAAVVVAKGSFIIDRLAYDLGKKSDATAEWVSKDITVTLDIKATAK